MSLNWKEIEAVLAELPLEGSRIQKVYQLNIHTLVFELFHPEEHFWQLYVEIGTPDARIHRISGKRYVHRGMKGEATQRFNQFLNSRIAGKLITEAFQSQGDRILTLRIRTEESPILLVFRFYSTSRANVIACDESYRILDILYRRPKQQEISGSGLIIEPPAGNPERFTVREHPADISFNSYIESLYMSDRKDEKEFLTEKILAKWEKELSALTGEKQKNEKALRSTSDGGEYRMAGELLSSHAYMLHEGMSSVILNDYEGNRVEIELKRDLSVGENINRYYQKYHKEKNRKDHLTETHASLEKDIWTLRESVEKFKAAEVHTLGELRALAGHESRSKDSVKFASAPGLYASNGKFDLLIGRNAKENELLLRSYARGNDYWMHTRDVPGGYVFIRFIKEKSVDLETILDAGNLAIHYSKAKGQKKVDLYFTQVKYLKKVKGGKQGLVLPTQEKNYTIDYDEKRVQKVLSNIEH